MDARSAQMAISGILMNAFQTLFALWVALVLPAVSFASAAELEWNQERVTALARDLVEPLEALRADLEDHPPSVPEKGAAHAAVLDDVAHLQLRVRGLAQQLASGAGRAETTALFREIESLESQAVKHTKEYPAPFDMHVYIDRVQRTTTQLARYYGGSSDSGDSSHK